MASPTNKILDLKGRSSFRRRWSLLRASIEGVVVAINEYQGVNPALRKVSEQLEEILAEAELKEILEEEQLKEILEEEQLEEILAEDKPD
jgi:hypothetical protein